MIDLSTLNVPAAAPVAPVPVDDLVAHPSFAPRVWQSTAPEAAWGRRPAIEASDDLRRIIALPRRARPEGARAEALVELISGRYGLAAGPCGCATLGRECITRLRLAQAWALYELGLRGGLLGPIGVGHGKTILDLLTPLAVPDCRLAVLLVPPTLVGQLVAEYDLASQHFRVPSLVCHGRPDTRLVAGAPVLHVFPYSRLSRPEATSFLEQLRPDLVIADEVHKLRHADTATTSRVLRYFAAHPETRFAGWSGSLTDSSVKDYTHLAALALREGSPVPLDPEVAEEWSRALDPGDDPAPAGRLLDLCEPGEHVREGFHRRLVETPGVVSTTEPAVDAELEITERAAPPIPASVANALDDVRATWVRPDGEELVDALSLGRCLRELACGFYYRWTFPRGESVSTILEWLSARKEWRQEMRLKLRERREHLDSPLLCARAAMRGWGDVEGDPELPRWRAATWPRWRAAKHTVQYETEPVRLDEYLARDAAAWGHEHRGIVWFEHRAFGEWVAEISGLPLHGGGQDAGVRIGAERGDRSIIASIKSHGTGRDGLQRLFCEQLFANPSSSGTTWEQALGRLHRIGQRAPVVRAEFYRHTEELARHVDQALARALYVQGTLGAVQKLRAGWALPIITTIGDTA